MISSKLQSYPTLSTLFDRQLTITPRHANSLSKRFEKSSEEHLAMADQIASWIVTLAGENLDQVLLDYDWICQLVLDEELSFRRSGRYRLSTFAEAVAEVYSNDELMSRYMNGLLMTTIWWSNHTEASIFYLNSFLKGFSRPYRHLEIGPGHGMLLFLAGQDPMCQTLTAWDVSAKSLEKTRLAIEKLGGIRKVDLQIQDMFADSAKDEQFDSIVLSEVLEHLEHPSQALHQIRSLLAPNGRIFINMPINSPAPDHIFLLETPEAVVSLVESCGFVVEQSRFEPQTNMTLDKARRTQSTITTLIIATSRD